MQPEAVAAGLVAGDDPDRRAERALGLLADPADQGEQALGPRRQLVPADLAGASLCRLTLPACGAWTATTQEERLRSKATNSVAGWSWCIGRLPGGGWRATPRPYGRVVTSPHRVFICTATCMRAARIVSATPCGAR